MAHEGTSERACDRCRERRVKCDKRQPNCLRCEKLGKPCPGYDKKRKFVDESESLRKKYQTAQSHSAEQNFPQSDVISHAGASITEQSFLSPRSNYQSPQVSITSTLKPQDSPAYDHRTIDTTLNDNVSPLPNSTLPAIDPVLFPDQPNASAYDDIFNDPAIDPAWFNIEPDVFFGELGHSCGFIPSAPNIVDDVDKAQIIQSIETDSTTPMSFGTGVDVNFWGPDVQMHTSAIITDEREHEMAYLVRHFTEAIAPWMDLFDQDKHFGNLVPLKALRDKLLRNAIAAVAAKQLGRVKGAKAHIGIQCQKPATMEVIDDVPVTDWFYKAANYYDKAIAFSRVYLQAISGTLSSPNMAMTTSTANSEDLLVAVSIFSLYESLDNLEVSWLQHLAGFKTLLSTLTPSFAPQPPTTPTLNVGRLASFWNFARADYQAAYINHQTTFLNTEDLSLWRTCGLQLTDSGSLYPDPLAIKNDPSHCREIAETVSHTLLWLLLRVMNYLASDRADEISTVRQAQWSQLTRQLDEWYENLPPTFQPCAQIRYPLRRKGTHLMEVFFTMPVCAAALQLYHFARILLLLHKPIQLADVAGADSKVLNSFLASSKEAIKHAHLIIGIGLGRPPPAVRVEMLLPLYIAGVCLEDDEERRVLLELLRAIEMDTGCETEARCQELTRRWEWNSLAPGMMMSGGGQQDDSKMML